MKNLCNIALLAVAGMALANTASAQAKSAAAPAKATPAKSAKPAVVKKGAASAAVYDDARKAKIMENLKLKFPQLGSMNATLSEFKASPWHGLDEGTFSMTGPQGQQQKQYFVVTQDDKALFLSMTPEAINVSFSETERAAEKVKMDAERAKAEVDARRQAEEKMKGDAVKAKETAPEMAKSVEGLPFRGKANAPVTIVEFSDFQCPFCTRGYKTMEDVLKKYPNDVKFVFKHFPLPMHPWAKPASVAAYCAGLQNGDAFWMLHDGYFNRQNEVTLDNVVAKSKEFLTGSKLDMKKWSACAETKDSPEYKAAEKAVDDSVAFGQKHGVSGTPGFFVNGMFINGAQPVETFDAAIAAVKNAASAPAAASAPMEKKN